MNTSFKKNRGMATLLTTVIVLLLLTIMVIFATKVGILDQRMAANEARYKEAFATAEAGLDFAVQKFENEFRVTGAYTGVNSMPAIIAASQIASPGLKTDGTTAAANTASFTVAINLTGISLLSPGGTPGIPVYEVESTGVGADGTGTATIRRQLGMAQTLGGGAPEAPVIVDGSVGAGGDFNIVANPNGGGPGVPVSVWTGVNSDVEMGGSSATCHTEFYVGNNPQCSNPSGKSELLSQGDTNLVLSAYDATRPDILPNDSNFPADLFQYVFAVARADWGIVKAKAANQSQLKADCSGLGTTAGEKYALWWVTGDCNMGSNQVIGSLAKPVILVIDDHELDMGGGGAVIYGIVFLFNNPSNVATPAGDFHGTPAIYGALISDIGGSAMQGSYSIVYQKILFDNLTSQENSSNYDLAYIPGSWRDYE